MKTLRTFQSVVTELREGLESGTVSLPGLKSSQAHRNVGDLPYVGMGSPGTKLQTPIIVLLLGSLCLFLFAAGLYLAVSQRLDGAPVAMATAGALNTGWTVVSAAMALVATAGLVMMYAGNCRSRYTVNYVARSVIATCTAGLLYWAVGFSLMFTRGDGFIGLNHLFLKGLPMTYEASGVSSLAFFMFSLTFVALYSVITSAAMIRPTRFAGSVLFVAVSSGFLYPIMGHWVWGPDGFLATMGRSGQFLPELGVSFSDFAGSATIHSMGGMTALAFAIVAGPELGRRFIRDGGGPSPLHSNLTIVAVGSILVWAGWFGFTAGNTLSVLDVGGISRTTANTALSACSAALVAVLLSVFRGGYAVLRVTTMGLVGGLVAASGPCYWVNPLGAILIGIGAGAVVVFGNELLEWFRIDDPSGVIAVHGFCGFWGTISLGLLASGDYGGPAKSGHLRGLLYGGGAPLLIGQCIGATILMIGCLLSALSIAYIIWAMGLFQLSDDGLSLGEYDESHFSIDRPVQVPHRSES